MLKNYFKMAWRNVWRHKAFSAITITGLSVGVTAGLLLILYILYEVNYDSYFKHAGNIYRVTFRAPNNDPWLKDVPALAPGLAARIPEINNYTRLFSSGGLVKSGGPFFNETRIFFADTSFFSLFNFPFVAGNARTFQQDPNAVIITKSVARKYFGAQNPIGKILEISGNDGLSNYQAKVAGIIPDIPGNTHFHFDFLLPFRPGLNSRSNVGVYSYLLLSPGATATTVASKLNRLKKQYYLEWQIDARPELQLQPLTSIHLHSNFFDELETNGQVQILYIFFITAVLILIIAGINYINISMAQNSKRAKEIGVRKILGARSKQVILQFMVEALVPVAIAIALAYLFLEVGLPYFNQLTNKPLSLRHNYYLLLLLPLMLILGLVASLFPALVLANFKPVQALKNILSVRSLKTTTVRKALLVFQFSVAIILTICTVVIYKQLNYIQEKPLGFLKEQVLVLALRSPQAQVQFPILKQELLKRPAFIKVAASHAIPGDVFDGSSYQMPAENNNSAREYLKDFAENTLYVDEDYLTLMGIKPVAGQVFSGINNQTETGNSFILNEAAVKKYGWANNEAALGKTIRYFVPETRSFKKARVTGVVQDFHYASLHTKIEPLIIRLAPAQAVGSAQDYTARITTLSVKIAGNNTQHALHEIERAWKKFAPAYPLEYQFLDARLAALYASEQKLGQVFIYFSGIAFFITCIGLLGVSMLLMEQRTKEIGIRKVLGASVSALVHMLSKDFLKLVLLANIIAWPIGWFAINNWLRAFEYRTSISLWIFACAGAVALVIALITVSFQAVKAAIANPVKALRSE